MNTTTHLLQGLDGLGKWLIHTGGWLSLELLLLAVLIFGLLKVTRLRSAKARQWLWTLVLVKPLIALLIAWPFGIGVRQSMTNVEANAAPPLTVLQGESASVPDSQRHYEATPKFILAEPTRESAIRDSQSTIDSNLSGYGVLAGLWLTGVLCLSLYTAMGLAWLLRLRRRSTRLESHSLDAVLTKCLAQLKLPQPVEVRVSDQIKSPLVFGFWRSTILLPRWCVERFEPQEIELMLLHELSHLRAFDPWLMWLKRLSEVIFWFHPAIWYVSRQVLAEAGQACDDAVVALSARPKRYASCLVRMLERIAGSSQCYTFAGLAPGASPTGKRVRRLLDDTRNISTRVTIRVFFAILLVGMVSLPSIFCAKAQPELRTADLGTTFIEESEETAVTSSKSADKAANRGNTTDEASERSQKEFQKQEKQKQKRSRTMTARDSALIERLRGLGFREPATIPRDELIPLLFEIDKMNSSEGREAALEALGLTGDAGAEVLIDIYDDSSDVEVKKVVLVSLAFVRNSPKAIEKLDTVARTDEDPKLRKKAIQALALTGSDVGAGKLAVLYDDSDDVQIKEEIIKVLLISRSTKAIGKLDAIAREDQNPKLRKEAVKILALKGNEGAEKLISLYGDSDAQVKEQIIKVLITNSSNMAVEKLGDIVREEQNPKLRGEAIKILALKGDKGAEKLIPLYDDSDAQVKEQIIKVLITNSSNMAVEKLGDIAREERNPELRKKAIEILALKGNQGAEKIIPVYDDTDDAQVKQQIIEVMLTNGSRKVIEKLGAIAREEQNPKLRKKAIEILALKGNQGAERLILLYDESDDPQVKEQILEVMLLNNSPKVIEKLESIVQSEKDPRLRKAAIKTLGLKY